jgi:ABC-type sugar transport system ATPase subunit
MNVVAGVFPPDAGELLLAGQPVRFTSPRQARDHGIAMIFQELNLVPGLTVAENIFLGREPLRRCGLIDYAALNRRAAAWLQRLDLDIPPTTPTGRLRVGQQQVVEIAKALAGEARILIMDEPTSALTERETEVLFQRITDLKRQGVAIAYITHKLDELARIGDDAAVMRDGRMIGAAPLSELSRPDIVRMMVGRDLGESFRSAAPVQRRRRGVAGRATGAPASEPSRRFPGRPRQLSGAARRGVGDLRIDGRGPHRVAGMPVRAPRPGLLGRRLRRRPTRRPAVGRRRHRRGPGDGPEDRKQDGLVLSMSVAENASLASLNRAERFGLIRPRAEREHVRGLLAAVPRQDALVAAAGPQPERGQPAESHSGQMAGHRSRVLLLDEPTRGIDVRAKQEIYALIDESDPRRFGRRRRLVRVARDLDGVRPHLGPVRRPGDGRVPAGRGDGREHHARGAAERAASLC